ncbi:MAG: hypothetical protein ACRCR9_01335 [Chitinophagaceae bacterium]
MGVGDGVNNVKRIFNEYSLPELIALERKYITKVVEPRKKALTKI